MRRDLKVNAGQERDDAPTQADDLAAFRWPGSGDEGKDLATPTMPQSESRRHGNCLYFGLAGERCDRPAAESGFCREHSGNREEADPRKPGRILAAVMAILALLWPVIGDVVQFIMRWLSRHR